MRHWFKDQHFRSLLKNTSYLAVSKGVAAVAALATLAFAGRGLGLAQFGLLILIASYAQAASGLSKFQSWQIVIRYGGRLEEPLQQADFKTATGFAFALDVVSGLAGMVVAMALLPLIGPWFGLKSDLLTYALIYCTLLPGSPGGSRGPCPPMSRSGTSPTSAAICTCGSSPGANSSGASCSMASARR